METVIRVLQGVPSVRPNELERPQVHVQVLSSMLDGQGQDSLLVLEVERIVSAHGSRILPYVLLGCHLERVNLESLGRYMRKSE